MKIIRMILNKKEIFVKYIGSSLISFILDLSLFNLFVFLLGNNVGNNIVISTVFARFISSFVNYLINKNSVFKRKSGSFVDKNTIFKYYFLVIIQMFVSGFLVDGIYNRVSFNVNFIKVPVEICLFFVNYFIQKKFIFCEKRKKININRNIVCIILGIMTSFSLIVDLDKNSIVNFSKTDTNVLLYFVLGLFLIFFYKKYDLIYKNNVVFKILASVFSLFMVILYSYAKIGNGYLAFGSLIFVLISIVKFYSFYKLFYIGINILYDLLCHYKINDIVKKSKFIKLFNAHPFICSFIIILLCYIPYVLAYYPAVLSPDPARQIKEFMGLHTEYMDSVVLIDPNVTITNFNPVLHTLLLGSCFKIGYNIGNVNFGLFIYTIIQMIIVLSCFSYSICFLKKRGVVNKILFIILGIYSLVPVFPFYTLSTNKDTIFCMFTLLYLLKLYEIITMKVSRKWCVKFFIIMILVTLTRNNGIYIILLSLPFTLIWLKDKRKTILILSIGVLSFNLLYNNVVLPYFKISNTSIREMLSIPFQQTARLAKYYPSAFSESDKEIVDKVLNFDTLAERYDPVLADDVKNEYNIYTTKEDLLKYFKAWGNGFVKKPLVYFDATINNVYGYFYPDTSNWYLYYKWNPELKKASFDFHFNNLSFLRSVLSNYGTKFPFIPVIGMFVNIAFVCWIHFFLLSSLIVKKAYKYLPLCLIPLSFILVCIASPANTYFRYAFPYITILPVMFSLLYYVFQEK